MSMKTFEEPITAIAPDGTPTPGTLAVIRVPDGLQAALYCRDDLYATIHKNRTDYNRPLWDADDATYLQYVRAVFDGGVQGRAPVVFDFVRPDIKAAADRPIADDLARHMARVALAHSADSSGRPH